jgi:hypothetical protein
MWGHPVASPDSQIVLFSYPSKTKTLEFTALKYLTYKSYNSFFGGRVILFYHFYI